jgi:glycerol-3-phosphate dehydrogenase subunit C
VAGTYRLKQQKYDIAMKVGAGVFSQIVDARPDLAVCHPETCHWHIELTGVRTLHRIENLDRAARVRLPAGDPAGAIDELAARLR